MATFSAKVTSREPVSALVMCLLHSVTNTHILHLQTTSYAEHMALGSFYQEIGDLVDGFVEAYQGKYGILSSYSSEFTLPENPIDYLRYLKTEVEMQRSKPDFPRDSELQNEVDNIANLINTTLYKLRFLK